MPSLLPGEYLEKNGCLRVIFVNIIFLNPFKVKSTVPREANSKKVGHD